MKSLTLFCTLATLLVPTVLSGPVSNAVNIEVYNGEKTGRHIVTLRPDVSKTSVLGAVTGLLDGKAGLGVTHEWDTVLNGFAGNFDEATLAALQRTPGVESISEDGIAHSTMIQVNAPWGLARLNSHKRLGCEDAKLDFKYNYDPRGGVGVDVYIIDTGIRTTHLDFGGRAKWGATFGGYNDTDGNGHGTHCAGTAVGGQYGVAKMANVIAVKVLSDSGSGSYSDVISGMNYVASKANTTGRPSVASMSLGGGKSSVVDNAVRNLVAGGVHVVVAAGNDNVDAKDTSPAGVAEAITVGASTITDERASFSNFGQVVDIFAPGLNVISTWKDSDTATRSLSGTSMATPHIAGLVAYILSVEGNMTPDEMTQKLKEKASMGLLNPYSQPADTVNLVANNGFMLQN